MRLIKMFGLTAVAAVAVMAFVGATSAWALPTALCTEHPGLLCPNGKEATSHHLVLASGTVGRILAAINVLCLGILIEATPLGLGSPQSFHSLSLSFSGCGTGSAHNNCTVSVPEQPLLGLLKTGLDEGVLTGESGQIRLQCSNLGLNCLFDMAGMEFSAGGGHLTAEENVLTELGGKFVCPDEGGLDGLFETLTDTYILG